MATLRRSSRVDVAAVGLMGARDGRDPARLASVATRLTRQVVPGFSAPAGGQEQLELAAAIVDYGELPAGGLLRGGPLTVRADAQTGGPRMKSSISRSGSTCEFEMKAATRRPESLS